MKFLDRFKLSLHNMWTSKSRTILTILIVFIVSTLIQVVGITCINLASNLNSLMAKELDESGSEYSVYLQDDSGSNVINMGKPNNNNFGLETVNAIYNVVKNDASAGLVSYTNRNKQTNADLGVSSVTLTAIDLRMPASNITLTEGRCWNTLDSNSNAIFIEKSVLENYNATNYTNCTVGDTLSIDLRSYSTNITHNGNYILKGIYENKKIPNNYNAPKIIFDVCYLSEKFGLKYDSATISNPKIENKNTLSIINLYNKTTKALNAILPIPEKGKFEAYNSFVDDSKSVIIMDIAIIAVGLIIGFIVLLLSIGSIANTMIISIDKNKKFTGLMMAMGLKPKSIKSVIRLEGAMTICCGILLSTVLCLAFIPVFSSVLGSIFNSMTYSAIAFKFTFPFYFPIGVAVVFILMAMLFTKAGVRGLIKQDPITVISEVG